MRYGKLLAGLLLGAALLLPAPGGEAASYDDDEIVTVVKGEEDKGEEVPKGTAEEVPQAEYKAPQPSRPTDSSRADDWFEKPEEIGSNEGEQAEDGTPKKERYILVARDESGFSYYLDTRSARWRYLPYSANEKIIDVWVKLLRDEAASGTDYSYPETYFMEHYYLRPDRQQIQFLCELEVTGRPQNAIKERDYSPGNWENLVPGSIEEDIYHATVEYLKKNQEFRMTRHGKNITVRDALEEFFRISL